VESPPKDDIVASLLRGLDVLGILSAADQPLSLAEVARLGATTRATARRLLLTLERIGYVATDGPTFWLRPKVMELGDAYLDGLGLPRIAHPHLAALAERVRDTCSLTVLDGDTVVYVDRVKAPRMMTVNIAIGTRLPAYVMSSGRVLLADLPEDALAAFLDGLHAEPITGHTRTARAELAAMVAQARTDGYAIADQEIDPALRAVAAPVRGPDGRAVGAVNVATHVTRASLEQLRDEVLPELLATTRAIEADLAIRPGSALPPAAGRDQRRP
jgi:IclR family pca regulon transcriptional regulator